MDHDRFDDLSRRLTGLPSRRGVLAGLTSALFAIPPLALGGEEAKARKKRKRKKKGTKGKRQQDGRPSPPVATSPPPPPPPGCVPTCNGNVCGPDGCGGSCGTCSGDDTCVDGGCTCVRQCAPANACGPDGCGGSCGECPGAICSGTAITEHVCDAGTCQPVVTPCGAGQVCFENACCERQPPSTCRQEPEDDGCGGTYPVNCPLDRFCCPASNGNLTCRTTPCP